MGEVAEHAGLANVLEARERMNALTDMAAASGNLKRNAHRGHMRDLERQGRGRQQQQRRAAAPQTFDETVARFATVGVEVVRSDSVGHQDA